MDSKNENTTRDDPFAYLERNTFTSEKFKIEVRGLPKFYGLNEFKKLLNKKLGLQSCKIKPPKRKSEWIYVCFRKEDDRQRAITVLNGYKWKNRSLTAHEASAVRDPLVQKRCENKSNESSTCETTPKDINREELLKLNTVPLWKMPYEKQLELKTNNIKSVLEELTKELRHFNRDCSVRNLLEERCRANNGILCELSDIRHAPYDTVVNGYRNKCEFTVGLNEENGSKTVGFRYGSYVQGTISVGSIANLPHVSQKMKEIVRDFETFIQQSDLNVYDPETHSGFWKQLTIRLGMNTGQVMIIVGINVEGVLEDVLTKAKSDIVEVLINNKEKSYEITSLYLQTSNLKTNRNSNDSFILLHGTANIVEELCGLKFFISPLSFFQTNTAAADVLYSAVGELTVLSPKVTVIDICCGTGSIGLCLAKSGAEILGIESQEAAVENARFNCEQNNLKNCTFFCGRAEDILTSVICKASNDDIVAIVDPPRAGLHMKALTQLRRANINKLVYLSCNPKAALSNFITLGKPTSKTLFGAPFLPVKAIPVDNFPHTNHCELVLYFERYEIPNSVCD